MEIAPGVHSIDLEWRFEEPLTVQVVEGEKATVAVGGGDESTVQAYHALLQQFSVDVVLVEHGDPDHYGSLLKTDGQDLGIEIAVPAGDAHILEEAGIEVDHRLKEGAEYWGLQTISVPGHTPDNMSYLYDNVLLAGDTVIGSDSLFSADRPWNGKLGVIDPNYNSDDEQAKSNIPKLVRYDFDVVLVAHGSNVTSSGLEEVRTLIDDLSTEINT